MQAKWRGAWWYLPTMLQAASLLGCTLLLSSIALCFTWGSPPAFQPASVYPRPVHSLLSVFPWSWSNAALPTFKASMPVRGGASVWGGYWKVWTTDPPRSVRVLDSGQRAVFERWSNSSCQSLALQVPEPFSHQYLPRNARPTALPGGAPRAWYQWGSNITWSDFQKAQNLVDGVPGFRMKRIVNYKIINNQLYKHGGSISSSYSQFAEEMMLVALHLFKVPDTDLALQFSDTCPFPGVPAIAWATCRNNTDRGGFTMPSYRTWQHALGPHQLSVLHSCFDLRYPKNMSTRVMKAFWRGSSNDPRIDEFNASNCLQAARIRAHHLSLNSSVLDARLTGLVGTNKEVREALNPSQARRTASEDSMSYAAVMDLDGHGWSDRFHSLFNYNTPVLKQASNYTAYFEHLSVPGHSSHQFANDARDLEVAAKNLIMQAQTPAGSARLFEQVSRRQNIAAAALSQIGAAEAMAYTLSVYADKITWKVGSSLAYHPVPWTSCCRLNPSLPEEFVQEVRSHPPPPTMRQLRAAGLQPGLEGDATTPFLERTTERVKEAVLRIIYPYLWDSYRPKYFLLRRIWRRWFSDFTWLYCSKILF